MKCVCSQAGYNQVPSNCNAQPSRIFLQPRTMDTCIEMEGSWLRVFRPEDNPAAVHAIVLTRLEADQSLEKGSLLTLEVRDAVCGTSGAGAPSPICSPFVGGGDRT